MSFYMDSDRGNVRQNNEDSFLFEQFEKLNILILADGVGGHEDGEIASGYAVNIVMEYIKSNYKLYSDYLHLLVDAFCEANKVIYEINLEKNSGENKISNRLMGTTLEVLLFDGDVLYFGHVGDSRIYIKDDNFRLLTKDHSLVQYLYSSGALTEEEVKNYNDKNSILRAIGMEKHVEVDVSSVRIKPKDIILVCSDGLTNELDDDKISEMLDFKYSAKEMVDNIISTVKNGLARDNVTVGIFKNDEEIIC
ncbi:PP2C family protein-serine/threonine phosphatase [Parvimonas micra]|uniref:Protein phosphatase 2C domain-containing protein n=1 Tax=Parvimonas micra TaxID=33033 RepID=A0A9X3HA52_9FIRM|nr:protein phosphatase 2C domain-containing protein [Parvimonas micra]MCZ7407111.1 protein phosphatase 2C domain-containing protein [Parvimonas micra]MCZ7408831.1 protein phosphatase 2C domain-containing protein [Parvimonas micra]MCZ7410864.1 protein phosphatase 2C domain-containing protein [Parvimonas micra]MCZ7411527.1 protein phosphatase 2C domain-containing protein [Parvimonas micra]WBB37437.1 protein phosphatase 2C domain-containing protein [Parvimonas micra]